MTFKLLHNFLPLNDHEFVRIINYVGNDLWTPSSSQRLKDSYLKKNIVLPALAREQLWNDGRDCLVSVVKPLLDPNNSSSAEFLLGTNVELRKDVMIRGISSN